MWFLHQNILIQVVTTPQTFCSIANKVQATERCQIAPTGSERLVSEQRQGTSNTSFLSGGGC